MTVAEIKEMKTLQTKLMGNDYFVEVDFNNPDWIRLNELSGRYIRFMHRLMVQAPLQTFNQVILN